jgi:polysaccharide chain length determinant protein (PEP-CTERM system associated)
MINPGKGFDIHDYVEIFLRRKWYIIIPFLVISTGTAIYTFTITKLYRADTLILVTPQKVPTDYVRPTVTSRIEDRLQSIGQEIMSRTRLAQVISELKLYTQESKSHTRDEIIEMMRRDIKVEIKGPQGYFTISYIGRDPRIVTLVTNKLASLFIEENLRLREQQAQGTTEFLGLEVASTKTKLEEQENSITQFKRQFMNELPEQRESNLRVLDQLQLQYQRIGDSLKAAQDRKLIIQKQLTEMKQMIALMPRHEDFREPRNALESPLLTSSPVLPKSPVGKDSNEAQLEQMKNTLAELRSKYTEKHPDIVRTKRRIADLEGKLKSEQSIPENVEVARVDEKAISPPPVSPLPIESESDMFSKELQGQLAATDLEIKRIKEDELKVAAKIAEYRVRVENTPVRELGMTNLSRDYQNTKQSYESLLKKSQEAQQAENLERRQKGEQFKVIDPGRIPEKPFKPNIPRNLMIGLLLGLACSFGVAFLREQMDHSFRDAEDLEAAVGLRVLANIPAIGQNKAA